MHTYLDGPLRHTALKLLVQLFLNISGFAQYYSGGECKITLEEFLNSLILFDRHLPRVSVNPSDTHGTRTAKESFSIYVPATAILIPRRDSTSSHIIM